MNRHIFIALLVALGFLAATGCAQLSGSGAEDFGDSVHQFQAAQTLNPGPVSLEPVTGLDGKYARKAMQNYQDLPRPAHEAESKGLESNFDIGGESK